ncbi:hypothetical protein ACFY0G_08490 [Streptomyces sp. NPDC001552]|uniref:hypothetical protein n=1 Tax=Streptomyces sp. NPDC001552 TaxID=3364587 RepID=UPI0036C42501
MQAISAGQRCEGDDFTFTEQEIDRTCRASEEGRFVSDARPIRDLQPTGGFALPRMPAQRCRNPVLITTVERAAASAALGCPPWELGPCAECGLLCTDSEIEAVIEAPAEDLITIRQVLTQVLGYGRADAVPTRVGI